MGVSRWPDFGFPGIALAPVAKGMRALEAALHERRIAQALPNDYEYTPAILGRRDSGRSRAVAFDASLSAVASNYIDMKSRAVWTLKTLSEALKETLIDPKLGDLRPEWCYAWALQRYRMINLLKLYKSPAALIGTSISGSVHNGEPMSANAAMNVALKEAEEHGEQEGSVSLQRIVESIYGPSHGWEEGSYCANVYQVGKVKIDVEALKDEEGNLPEYFVAFLEVYPPYNDPGKFDSFGTGLTIGENLVDVQADGTIYSFSLPGSPDVAHSLPDFKTTVFGFYGNVFTVADVSPRFTFLDEIKIPE